MALFGKKPAVSPTAAPGATVEAPVDANGDAANGSGANGDAAPVVAPQKVRKVKTPKSSGVKSGTIVGLNIGNAFIKAVEVTSKGGQLAVTGVGVVATPPESYANGNVLSVTALTNALRILWKQAGLSTKATVLSVAGTGSLVVRVIEVPKMTDGELVDNMRVDADRYIPFPPSEVVMDFKALRDLPSDPDAANMEVLLAAAQREIIDLHVSVVQKAKLDPRAIDVEPIALARALQLETRAAGHLVDYDDVSAVLNIGETGTEISILRGDIVVFTRSVPNGGGALTSAIAQTLGLPPSDAERLKIENGSALPPAGYAEASDEEEDFGFGDFGDATSDDLTSGGDGNTVTFDVSAPGSSAATGGSDDPFDLDFFDQGGTQSEPGAGHGQKEEDEEDAKSDEPASGFNFSFDKLDDDLTPSRSKPAPSLEDLDLSDEYLPAATGPVGEPEAPPATMPSAFDFSDFDLPTTENVVAPLTAEAVIPAPSAPAPTMKLSDAPDAPAPLPTPPIVVAPVAETPVVVAPVAETTPVSFGFDGETPDTTEVVIAPVEAELPTQSSAEVEAAPVSEASADSFGLDDIFGGAPGADSTAQSGDAVGFDVDAIDFGAAPAATGDFGVSGLDMEADNDDFSSFGTGLSQTGTTDANTLYAAMQPVLEDLATEVRRSLEFHLGRYPDTTFSRLILVGGGAKLRDLDQFLEGNLGVPTSVGNPFSHIEVRAPRLPSEFVPTNAPLCAVALGLALRDFIE